MENILPGTEEKETQYYEELLTKIRKIKKSELSPKQKLMEVVKCAIDYNPNEANTIIAQLFPKMAMLGPNGDLRFVNCLIMYVESWFVHHHPLTMKDLETNQRYWLMDADNNQHIYEFPSFCGVDEDDEDGTPAYVRLPKELENFKGGSMILKIEDMDRFVDTFCSRDTYYRRAYDILAELDKSVLESLENGEFSSWIDIDYKDGGCAMFEFSHFEVDLREPDSKYRTLYVVYRYDTSAS